MPLSLTGTSTTPTRDASAFAAPASLPTSVVAANEARRRSALSDYQEATVRGSAEMGRVEADRITASKDLAAAIENSRFTGMSGLASIGQARSPRFADRLRRDLTRQELRQRGEMERQAAMQMGSIEEMIANARRARDRQLLQLESDEVLQRTALQNIFTPPVFRTA
jgi:hypothetical protein